MKQEAYQNIREQWLSRKDELVLDFEAEDVGVRTWGGKVWELYRKPDKAFLELRSAGRQTGRIDVYVAEIDGELKVVR